MILEENEKIRKKNAVEIHARGSSNRLEGGEKRKKRKRGLQTKIFKHQSVIIILFKLQGNSFQSFSSFKAIVFSIPFKLQVQSFSSFKFNNFQSLLSIKSIIFSPSQASSSQFQALKPLFA